MWVKICGIKEAHIARCAVAHGASAIGLNFFSKSVRSVKLPEAEQIAGTVRGKIDLVGLFVNHDLDDVVHHAEALKLDWIQLHGDEPVSFLKELQQQLPGIKLLKAFRVGSGGLTEVAVVLDECEQLGVKLSACLIDAAVKGEYGGTGHIAPWNLIREQYDYTNWPKLILAGGLTPENIQSAIDAVEPWGVDLASGVESEPGVKDQAKIEMLLKSING
ncbi:MAG: phosphoribosylanthranilate isomerase [Planctomycetaceae bacterium]